MQNMFGHFKYNLSVYMLLHVIFLFTYAIGYVNSLQVYFNIFNIQNCVVLYN